MIAGIGLGATFPETPPPLVGTIVIAALLLGLVCHQSRRSSTAASICLFTTLVALGSFRYLQTLPSHQPGHFAHMVEGDGLSVIRVGTSRRNKIVGDVQMLADRPVTGKILLYGKSETIAKMPAHAFIVTRIQPKPIPGPRNPGEFDARSYYAHQGVHHQAWIGHCSILGTALHPWQQRMENFRTQLREQIQRIATENERAICLALILGDRRELGSALKNSFADTGAMHILAVSGLHVGVVFLSCTFLLSWLPVTRWPVRLAKFLLVMLVVWGFAWLTGASISVIRAALICTTFETASLVRRRAYSINNLAAAAFILLLWDPHSLFSVGFQLSFLAVLGILTVHRALTKLWIIEFDLGHRAWELVALSVAAQVFTLPLTLYYFHQFPLYFWLSGITVVPLAFVLLTSGLAYLVTAWLPWVGSAFYYLMYGTAWLMNTLVHLIQQIPRVVVEDIWIDRIELMLIALVSAAVVTFVTYRRGSWAVWALGVLLCLTLYQVYNAWSLSQRQALVFYHVGGSSYGEALLGRAARPLTDGQFAPYYLASMHARLGIDHVGWPEDAEGNLRKDDFVGAWGWSAHLADASRGLSSTPADLIWLQPGFQEQDALDMEGLPSQRILIDGSIREGMAAAIEQVLVDQGHEVHNTWSRGALILDGRK